jgi:PadR family transcriptional regulator PadR
VNDDLGLLPGTLDMLVLRALRWGPAHGYAVARWIHRVSDEALSVEDRALYLSLHRLAAQRLVRSEWGVSENNRRARFYQITSEGRQVLRARSTHWGRYAEAIFKVLTAADGGVRP